MSVKILTPSSHPTNGIRPTTQTVTQAKVTVANRPTSQLQVARSSTGNAQARPIPRPRIAESASVCKYTSNDQRNLIITRSATLIYVAQK